MKKLVGLFFCFGFFLDGVPTKNNEKDVVKRARHVKNFNDFCNNPSVQRNIAMFRESAVSEKDEEQMNKVRNILWQRSVHPAISRAFRSDCEDRYESQKTALNNISRLFGTDLASILDKPVNLRTWQEKALFEMLDVHDDGTPKKDNGVPVVTLVYFNSFGKPYSLRHRNLVVKGVNFIKK